MFVGMLEMYLPHRHRHWSLKLQPQIFNKEKIMKRGTGGKYNKEENTKKNHKSYLEVNKKHYTIWYSAVNSGNGMHGVKGCSE